MPIRLTWLSLAASAVLLSAPSAPAKLDFTGHYDGRGAEGIDDIWRGTLDTRDAGVVVFRIECHATSPDLHALVFVSRDSLARSFGADVTGRRSDDSTMHFTGTIDVGHASRTAVDVFLHEHHGTIRFAH